MSVCQLSSAERNVVRDYIRHGSLVRVAELRGRSVKTIETQVRNARDKCGGVSLVQLCILVDRIGDGVEFTPQNARAPLGRLAQKQIHTERMKT